MTNAATRLAWHQERRGRGVPTVSAFVGPPGLGVRAWRAWVADRAVAQTASPDPGALARAWLAAAGDLAPAAESWVLRQPWGGGARLADATAHDLATLRREADPDDRAAAVAFAVLAARAAATHVAWPDPIDAAAGFYRLAPPAGWPALLVVPAAGDGGAAARGAARFAVDAPGVPVAVCLTAEAFARLVASDRKAVPGGREVASLHVAFGRPVYVHWYGLARRRLWYATKFNTCARKSATDRKFPRRNNPPANPPNQISTWFSHDVGFGV